MSKIETPPLCIADDATFWPWRTWTEFARLTSAEKAGITIIVPIAGFADWGLGHALDTEELNLEQVKWVVLMVLSCQPGQEAACARMEDLLYELPGLTPH